MAEKIDHDEARRIAETFLATPDHVDEDSMDKLPAAYLDLRRLAESFCEPGAWHARTSLSEEAGRRLAHLRRALEGSRGS